MRLPTLRHRSHRRDWPPHWARSRRRYAGGPTRLRPTVARRPVQAVSRTGHLAFHAEHRAVRPGLRTVPHRAACYVPPPRTRRPVRPLERARDFAVWARHARAATRALDAGA